MSIRTYFELQLDVLVGIHDRIRVGFHRQRKDRGFVVSKVQRRYPPPHIARSASEGGHRLST